MDIKKFSLIAVLSFLIILAISGCQPAWKIEISENSVQTSIIGEGDVHFYLEKTENDGQHIPLGQILYAKGYDLIEDITILSDKDIETTFIWEEIAYDSFISMEGKITIKEKIFIPKMIDINPSPARQEINLHITDIAPTVLEVLNWGSLQDAIGRNVHPGSAERGVLILLDGLQYEKLNSLIEKGQLPFFGSRSNLQAGLTVYPPITTTATGALLTGTTPQNNGVFGYGYRSTENTTIFDLAVGRGKTVKAIEGSSLAFNLRNAETILSGDRDGDGFSDDNVFENSLEAIQADMPDLLFIHFHDIDDEGHTYGPDSDQYLAAIIKVDEYLSQIYEKLPNNTFIAIFADHGMHAKGSTGTHGNLVESDLVIPILFINK